jgi:hypothetical protein
VSARVRQETTASSAQAVADAGTGAGASFCGERFLRGEITGSCGELDERKVSAGMSCPRQIESTVALAEEVWPRIGVRTPLTQRMHGCASVTVLVGSLAGFELGRQLQEYSRPACGLGFPRTRSARAESG